MYFGGKLWHPDADSAALRYNPGRQTPARDTCSCELHDSHCTWGCEFCGCKEEYQQYMRFEESKAQLLPPSHLIRPGVHGYRHFS